MSQRRQCLRLNPAPLRSKNNRKGRRSPVLIHKANIIALAPPSHKADPAGITNNAAPKARSRNIRWDKINAARTSGAAKVTEVAVSAVGDMAARTSDAVKVTEVAVSAVGVIAARTLDAAKATEVAVSVVGVIAARTLDAVKVIEVAVSVVGDMASVAEVMAIITEVITGMAVVITSRVEATVDKGLVPKDTALAQVIEAPARLSRGARKVIVSKAHALRGRLHTVLKARCLPRVIPLIISAPL